MFSSLFLVPKQSVNTLFGNIMSEIHSLCQIHEFRIEKIIYQQHVQTSPHSENHMPCFETAH